MAEEQNVAVDPMTALSNRQAELEKQIAALTDALNRSVETSTKLMETNAKLMQAQQGVPEAPAKAEDRTVNEEKVQELALASLRRNLNIKD